MQRPSASCPAGPAFRGKAVRLWAPISQKRSGRGAMATALGRANAAGAKNICVSVTFSLSFDFDRRLIEEFVTREACCRWQKNLLLPC